MKDEEIVFDYAMTESECISPFQCACAHINCRRHIIGAKGITKHSLQEYLPYLSNYIIKKLNITNVEENIHTSPVVSL